MKVGEARSVAADWVREYAGGDRHYRGAFFSGSTVGLPAGAELPPASDVDVTVVSAEAEPARGPGKFGHRGVLLEVSRMPAAQLASPEDVLGSCHLAGSFRSDNAIDDPYGLLRPLSAQVAARFADRHWVRRRCADARGRAESWLTEARTAASGPAVPFHQRVMAWLFGTGVTTHVLLAAALRNPTVRLRYLRTREVLTEYGLADRYAELLGLLGCRDLTAARVQRQLDALTETFDATAAVSETPFFFSGDLTAAARPVAVGGSQELIDRGDHREAVFWIVATFTRCHTVLAADAPELHRSLLPAFREAAADLGVGTEAEVAARADHVLSYLPRLWSTAEDVMRRNPALTG